MNQGRFFTGNQSTRQMVNSSQSARRSQLARHSQLVAIQTWLSNFIRSDQQHCEVFQLKNTKHLCIHNTFQRNNEHLQASSNQQQLAQPPAVAVILRFHRLIVSQLGPGANPLWGLQVGAEGRKPPSHKSFPVF